MEFSIWAIVIAVVVNIISNMLTPYIAKFLGNISASIKQRNERKKLIFQNSVQYILENPQEETNLRIRYWGRVLLSLIFMSMGLILMFSSNISAVVVGFIFFVIGNFHTNKANRIGKILDEVWKRKKANLLEIDLN